MKESEIESLKTRLHSTQNDSQSLKYKKLRDILVNNIFSSDPENEEMETLMNLDILKVFNKYEEVNNKAKIKNEDTTETLNEVKSKLALQLEHRDLLEKENIEIMKALNMNPNERSYKDILPAINNLKKSLEQNEEDHYTNAVVRLS